MRNTAGGQVTVEETVVAREELSKSFKKVRRGLDQVSHNALAGDKEAEFRTTVGQ